MKAAVYIRVSTDMQAEDGFSIEGQRAKLKSFADSQDWEIFEEYVDDGYSAKDLKRPAMTKMLEDMEMQRFDVVLVYKLDRLTRSVMDLHALLKKFDRYSVKFKSSTEIFETTTAMGRFFITLVGAMAEWERGTISERVRFGVEQMVKEGRRPGGVMPYGYTQEGELVEAEATLIRRARQLYMDGMGYKSVAMKLNGEGELRRGSFWTSATVAYTIENPFYAGIIRMGTKTAAGNYVNSKKDERVKCVYGTGTHPAIFTVEEYEQTKAFMQRKSSGGFSRISTYWFSGVLRCGRCGGAMFGRLTTKRSTRGGDVRTQYYICNNRHHSKTCDMPVFRQVHVEHLVMEYIKQVKIDLEQLKDESLQLENQQIKSDAELAEWRTELSKLKDRRERWQYMFVEELIDQASLRKHLAEENQAEQLIREKIAMNQKMLSGIPKVDQLADLEEVWPLLDDTEKKEYVYLLFNEIHINTPHTNPKGVKNKFFESYVQDVVFN